MLESPSSALYSAIAVSFSRYCAVRRWMFTAPVLSQEVSPRDKVKYVDGLLKRYCYLRHSCAGGFGLRFTGAGATLAVDELPLAQALSWP
jgi:hypothetical protein